MTPPETVTTSKSKLVDVVKNMEIGMDVIELEFPNMDSGTRKWVDSGLNWIRKAAEDLEEIGSG